MPLGARCPGRNLRGLQAGKEVNCLRERGTLGFWACSVAEHYCGQALVRLLPVEGPIKLPPVGLITLRGRLRTPAADQFLACLRAVRPMG